MAATAATIKPIEASSVHRIQSGQVIVDLCSVAKELVENGVDAGATSIEVRFKNQGLDSIEVQDNGSGIAPQDYESVALKHYTSKLSTYSDLTTLQTFGFRGEALSSLCALSHFTITTCRQSEVPKGTKLEFETSGKVKKTSVVAAQRGTTVSIENLFHNLPVRRRELERNIKREYNKVVSLLNQYACVQTGLKFTVSQQPTKGKRIVLFSTKGNATTRENIVNVFGAKTMTALIKLDLKLELEPTGGPVHKLSGKSNDETKEIYVRGHVSRPVHGEGRQTPDRQMFNVNGRPCGLPQFAKVFNEVYKSYNNNQSPFIFADIQLDTDLYDVNVSPDKRTILLHDQGKMLDTMREALIELFETQDVTLPISQLSAAKQTPFKRLVVDPQDRTSPLEAKTRSSAAVVAGRKASPPSSQPSTDADEDSSGDLYAAGDNSVKRTSKAALQPKSASKNQPTSTFLSRWVRRDPGSHSESETKSSSGPMSQDEKSPTEAEEPSTGPSKNESMFVEQDQIESETESIEDEDPSATRKKESQPSGRERHFIDFHSLLKELETRRSTSPEADAEGHEERDAGRNRAEPSELPIPAIAPPTRPQELRSSQMRPLKRPHPGMAVITIGDDTVTSPIGSPSKRPRATSSSAPARPARVQNGKAPRGPLPSFGGRLTQMFAASGSSERQRSKDPESPAEESHENGSSDVDHAESRSSEEEQDEYELNVPRDDKQGDNDTAALDVDAAGSQGSAFSEVKDENGHAQDGLADSGDDVDPVEEEEDDSEPDGSSPELETRDETEAVGSGSREAIAEGQRRSQTFLKGPKKKDSTVQYLQCVKVDDISIRRHASLWEKRSNGFVSEPARGQETEDLEAEDAEEKLSLIISKSDFGKMKIVGQFNLGFILAVLEADKPDDDNEEDDRDDDAKKGSRDDELFIIDQHASDEKYNFERLQASTVVQSQRLVQPKMLELTALEEEIIIENQAALETNGFVVRVDESGERPVGARCQLLSLPLTRETTFSLQDLEELVSLLGDHPASSASTVPRPSKVRKMFAMRACRSSLMIGRALSQRQMERVVGHMGEMEKPWNCPHGRPTMRHLCRLGAWDTRGWHDDLGGGESEGTLQTDWGTYVRSRKQAK